MAKLPTTFTTLDLAGFNIDQSQQYTSVTREMVDVACSVLQKNRVGIVTRSVQAALKHIYGIGGSADTICNLLKEWRSENLSNLKQGKNDKDLVSAILEVSDDGLLEETEIPEEYLAVTKQMAIATYRLAYQKADTSVAGARMKSLTDENDLMKQQLKDFPQLQLELNFYKNEYERQKVELREAYMNLNKQQLADSEQFKQRLDSLHQERNELESQLLQANNKLQQVAELESKESERTGEISRLNGQLEAREREISALHSQTQALQTAVGEKQVLESQLEQLKTQLKEANQTITNLQAKQKSTFMLEVDRFDESETKDETKSGKRNGKVTVAK
jgi:DNA repair exonuclease SbcCD ATPase subunit